MSFCPISKKLEAIQSTSHERRTHEQHLPKLSQDVVLFRLADVEHVIIEHPDVLERSGRDAFRS